MENREKNLTVQAMYYSFLATLYSSKYLLQIDAVSDHAAQEAVEKRMFSIHFADFFWKLAWKIPRVERCLESGKHLKSIMIQQHSS